MCHHLSIVVLPGTLLTPLLTTRVLVSTAAAVTTESSGRASPSAAVDEGWVSGTFAVSVDCQGLPASVCQLCGGSKDPEKCLKCARDSRAQYSKKPIKYLLNQGNKAQDACAVCASLSDTEVQDRWVCGVRVCWSM